MSNGDTFWSGRVPRDASYSNATVTNRLLSHALHSHVLVTDTVSGQSPSNDSDAKTTTEAVSPVTHISPTIFTQPVTFQKGIKLMGNFVRTTSSTDPDKIPLLIAWQLPGGTTINGSGTLTRSGSIVALNLNETTGFLGINGGNLIARGIIPASYRPNTQQNAIIRVLNQNTTQVGLFSLLPFSGDCFISADVIGNGFGTGGQSGFLAFTTTWIAAS